jgi:hypothetical protein
MGAGWRMARLFDWIFVATSFLLVVEMLLGEFLVMEF